MKSCREAVGTFKLIIGPVATRHICIYIVSFVSMGCTLFCPCARLLFAQMRRHADRGQENYETAFCFADRLCVPTVPPPPLAVYKNCFSRKRREGFFRAEPLDKLHRAKLHRAKLHRAKLHRAKLHRAKLHRAKLHRAKLHRAKLHGAKLHRAKLHRAKLHREPSYIEPSYIEPSYIEPSYIEPSYIKPSGTEPSYYIVT